MSQWFFSMRQPDRFLRSMRLHSDERKALNDALNPFAMQNETERAIEKMIEDDLNDFMADKPLIVGDVIHGSMRRRPTNKIRDAG